MALSLDFAFEGFRILKARPKLIGFWGLITLLGNGLAIVLLVAMAGPALEAFRPNLIQSQAGGQPSPETLLAIIQQVAPAMLVWQGISLVMAAILSAAIYRAALEDGDDGLGFLSFGARELQLILVKAVNQLILFGIPVVLMWLSLAVPGMEALSLLGLIAAAAAPWLAVRLSLNSVQTFAERRLSLFGSFALTRDVFWPLLGGYLICLVLAFAVALLGNQVVEGVVAVVFGLDGAKHAAPDMTSLAAFLTPQTVLMLVLSYLLVSPQVMTLLLAPSAAAYRRVTGKDNVLKAEEVF